jgi:TonB family protein
MPVNTAQHKVAQAGRALRARPLQCIVLGAALLTAACGPAVGRGSDLGVRTPPACGPETMPEQLPTVAQVVDVARLAALLEPLRPAHPDSQGFVLLSLTWQPDGTNIRRDVVQHTLDPVRADSVQELVFATLVPVEERPQEWGARLRIDLSGSGAYAVEPRVYCPPRPRSRELRQEMAQYLSSGVRYRGGRRERTVLVEVDVRPGGFVEDARIVRGGDPGSSLERSVRDFVRQYTFEPASLDGVPVAGRLTIPVRISG